LLVIQEKVKWDKKSKSNAKKKADHQKSVENFFDMRDETNSIKKMAVNSFFIIQAKMFLSYNCIPEKLNE